VSIDVSAIELPIATENLAPNASETNALIDDVAMTNKQEKDGASEVPVNKVVPLE